MTAAVPFNPLNKFKGEVREPAKFWDALAEADSILAERDDRAELACRIQEIEADRDSYKQSAKDLSAVLQSAFEEIGPLRAERDDLAEELADLRILNRRLVSENARLRNERDTMVAAVSAAHA